MKSMDIRTKGGVALALTAALILSGQTMSSADDEKHRGDQPQVVASHAPIQIVDSRSQNHNEQEHRDIVSQPTAQPSVQPSASATPSPSTKPSSQPQQPDHQSDQKYWGSPSRDISGDSDQDQYDQNSAAIPGVAISGARVFSFRGIQPAKPASNLLINHNGPTLAAPTIYTIWWGPSFPAGYQSGISNFIANSACAGSTCKGLNALVNQYFKAGTTTAISLGTTFTDPSTPPASAPTTATILSETYKVVVTTAKKSIDPNGIYLVLTSNFPARAAYCAWHGAGSVNGGSIFKIGYMPNLTGVSGCGANALGGYTPSSAGIAVDSVVNVATHELYETITDPLLNAWYDSLGSEIGDKCAWGSATKVTAGLTYSVQQEWSNLAGACASN